MLTGLILASVFGALALPELTRFADTLGLGGDQEDDGTTDPVQDTQGDILAQDDTPEPPEPDSDTDGPTDPGPDVDPETDLEILTVDAVPGVTEFADFDPETQEIALQVPENSTGYLTAPADPDADPPLPAKLTFEVPDGAVEILFPGMEDVPVDAISISVAGADAVGIAQVLLNDDPGLVPDTADDPAVPGDPAPGDPILPDDGETPADPTGPDLVDPDTPPILPNLDDDPLTLAAQPQRIEGFDPETDVLEVSALSDAQVSVLPSEDAIETQVLVDNALVAVVAVPNLPESAIKLVPVA